jgi:hypothetical protein
MEPLLILPSPNGALVFGMDWLPLIGNRLERSARRIAREYKATHLVLGNGGVAAVGLAVIPASVPGRRCALVSAAQCLAGLFPSGTVALMLEVAAGRFWVAAIHDGAVVTGTDRLYAEADAARAAIGDLAQAFPLLTVLGTPGVSQAPSLSVLEAAHNERARLTRVRGTAHALRSPAGGLSAILVAVLLAAWLWRPTAPVRARAVAAVPDQDPVAAWRRAIGVARQGRVVHGFSGTRLVLDSFYDLPTVVAGWLLVRASCVPDGSGWRCDASYRRRKDGKGSDAFLDASPGTWQVSFPALEQARAAWHLDGGAVRLARHSSRSVSDDDRHLLGRLQALSPAFTRLELGRPVPLKVAPPRDRRGRVLVRPPGLPRHVVRSVRVTGPLRSAGLLAPLASSVEWSRIAFTAGDVRSPSLTSSRFVISFEGVLHETESPGEDPASPGMARVSGGRKKAAPLPCPPGACPDAGHAGSPGLVGQGGASHSGG